MSPGGASQKPDGTRTFPRPAPFVGLRGWQVIVLLAAWVYLCALHHSNNGLWFQSDAPRHAANGLFWKDFLLSGSLDPEGYALSYYARYPVIYPTAYPPAFYLLEGAAFALFGASPSVAQALVLGFALLAALYALAWLRRWVGPEAGWAAALVLLCPGVVRWSHVVMLNVPALALSLAALYHARRWLEEAAPRQLYLAAGLGVFAVLTYYPAAVLALVAFAWLFALRRWQLLWQRRTLRVIAVSGLLVLPCALVALRFAPVQVGQVGAAPSRLLLWRTWTYYPIRIGQLMEFHLVALAAGGAVAGLLCRRWRQETVLLLIWIGVCYVVFSYISAREGRYFLPVILPLVGLGAIALLAEARWLGTVWDLSPEWVGVGATAAILVLVGTETWLATQVPVPVLSGFRPVVEYLKEVAPDEPVLYDGPCDAVFTFHVQADDPDYRRRVVLGRELLADTPQSQVLSVLRSRGGCRWFVIERSGLLGPAEPSWTLRSQIHEPDFELVRSFPMVGRDIDRLEVYRLLGPVQSVEEVELPFPTLGDKTRHAVRPIPTRGGDR
jgi:hypothetical protein